jgi:hypothetical protein
MHPRKIKAFHRQKVDSGPLAIARPRGRPPLGTRFGWQPVLCKMIDLKNRNVGFCLVCWALSPWRGLERFPGDSRLTWPFARLALGTVSEKKHLQEHG